MGLEGHSEEAEIRRESVVGLRDSQGKWPEVRSARVTRWKEEYCKGSFYSCDLIIKIYFNRHTLILIFTVHGKELETGRL